VLLRSNVSHGADAPANGSSFDKMLASLSRGRGRKLEHDRREGISSKNGYFFKDNGKMYKNVGGLPKALQVHYHFHGQQLPED